MSLEQVQHLMLEFEAAMQTDRGEECWSARRLAELLGYGNKDWGSFENAIHKAEEACARAGGDVQHHFQDTLEPYILGAPQKPKSDVRLTRWGAYLVAMNGDVKKERIAFAQVYFIARTQQAEVIEERLALHDRVAARKELTMSEAEFSKAMIKDANLTGVEVAVVRSAGDKALFGKTTDEMKTQYGMVDKYGRVTSQPLGDRAPTIILRGKAFAAELTKERIHRGLRSVRPIAKAHEGHNADVRKAMENAGVIPENLPPEVDTKELERTIKHDQKEAMKILKAKRQLSMKPPKPMMELSTRPEPFSIDGGGTPLPFED